jgi:hypothetical protein
MLRAGSHLGRLRRDIRTLLAKPYSGLVVATAIGLVAALLLTGNLMFELDWAHTWRLIGFPGIALPPFFDLWVVLDSGAKCAEPGNSYPYVDAPCHPWGRFNYPPVWLLLGRLGINGSHTAAIALLFEFIAIVLFVTIVRERSIWAGLLALLLALSPSTVLAFERANVDIVEWDLMCAAALLFREGRAMRAFITFVLLAVGIVLKFLPAFCCTLFIRLRSTSIRIAMLLGVFTLGYIYVISDVMAVIRRTTPMSPFVSYGYPVIFDRIEHIYAPRFGLNFTGLAASRIPIFVVAAVLAIATATAFYLWRRSTRAGLIADNSTGVLFLFGSGVFCGTFLLGTNFTYRLIVLLLCLPQVLDWIEPKISGLHSRILGYVIFCSSVVSMWLKFHPELTYHVNQLTDWILFGVLTEILVFNFLRAFRQIRHSGLRYIFYSATDAAARGAAIRITDNDER